MLSCVVLYSSTLQNKYYFIQAMSSLKKGKNILNNSWTIATGSAILGVIGIRIIDYALGTKFLASIGNVISVCFNAIINFLSMKFEVSLWLLGLIPIAVIGVIILMLWVYSLIQNDKSSILEQQNSFLNYKEDVFGDVLYRWNYFRNFSDKYEVSNISHYCPKCKCSIVSLSCPICYDNFYGRIKSNYEVDALIRYTIENKIISKP